MGSGLTRRHALAALFAGGLMPTFSFAARAVAPEVMRRWASGNTQLAPLAWLDDALFFSGDRQVGCIRPDQAQPLWLRAHGLPSEAVYRPRAAGERVITGGLHELAAWSRHDGAPLWRYRAITQTGTPCVTPELTLVGDGHRLQALDNQDGHLRWSFAVEAGNQASYAPAVEGETVFFGPGDGVLYALDRASGRLKWRLDEKKNWQYVRQMYVSGGVLVAGTYTELLYGIDAETGQVLWTFKAGNFINSHHVSGSSAYLWSPTGYVYAIDIDSGSVRWRHQTTRYFNGAPNWGPMMAELVTLADKLYALDMNNQLHVLASADGTELERVRFDQGLRPSVIARPDHQALVATDSGEVQWVRWTPRPLAPWPPERCRPTQSPPGPPGPHLGPWAPGLRRMRGFCSAVTGRLWSARPITIARYGQRQVCLRLSVLRG